MKKSKLESGMERKQDWDGTRHTVYNTQSIRSRIVVPMRGKFLLCRRDKKGTVEVFCSIFLMV